MHTNKPLKELHHTISQKVIGQPELISKLLTTLQLHDLKQQADSYGHKTDLMSNLLIIGGTGTGKTLAVREAVKAFGFSLIELNAKTFSQEGGWAGESFSTQVNAMWKAKTYHSPVIFIDEIDKIIRPNYEAGGSDVNHSIQDGLLKFIEGAKTPVDKNGHGGFDLSNACFIFAGAFTGLLDTNESYTVGFFKESKETAKTTEQRLVHFGMAEELLGRINRIAITNDITKGMLHTIAVSNHSMYQEYNKLLDTLRLNRPEARINIDDIVEKALQLKLGVRGLNQLFMKEIDKLIELQFTDKSIDDNVNPYHIRRLT